MIFNLLLILFISILYLLICSNSKTSNKKQVIFLRIVFFTFFVLVASREMTRGNDTQMYLNLFRNCAVQKWQFLTLNEYFEKGYLVLNILISYISKNPRFFMVIMSAIMNYCCYRFIKENSKNYYLSTLMYVCFLFFYTSMTMMRQFLAFCIMLLGIKFAKEKKPVLFVLTTFFASLFHSSVWLTLLYYPIYNMKYTRKKALLIIILGVLIMFNLGPIINYIFDFLGRVNYYDSRLGSESISNVIYAVMYFTFYIFVIYESRKKKSKEINSMYLLSILVTATINLVAIRMNIISRAAFYFNFLTIISLPNIIEQNVINISNKRVVEFLLILFLTVYSSSIIYLKPEWNSAYDYKSCIFPKNGYVCTSD